MMAVPRLVLLCSLILLTACGAPAPTPTPVPSPTEPTVVPPTFTTLPTQTPATSTPIPKPTPDTQATVAAAVRATLQAQPTATVQPKTWLVNSGGLGGVYVGATPTDSYRAQLFAAIGDTTTRLNLEQMALAGAIFYVTDGTRVTVLDVASTSAGPFTHIQIGSGPARGQTGWIASNLIDTSAP
jgi:hypothetical protein